MKLILVPLPSALSTVILPLCFSMNSLQSINPKPVLGSLSVPSRFTFSFILKRLSVNSLFIPMPVSVMHIRISVLFSGFASIEIVPFLFVNLIEFETKFLMVNSSIFLSAMTERFSGISVCNVISFWFKRLISFLMELRITSFKLWIPGE